MKSFKLTIAAIDKKRFEGEVKQVTVPAENGEMTILANHTPVVALLKSGKILIKTSEDKEDAEEIEIKKGALEFSNNECNIIIF